MFKRMICVICFIMLLGVFGSPAQGAKITWGPPVEVTSVDVIDLSGTLVHAGSWGQAGLTQLSVTVGGQTIVFNGTADPGKPMSINNGGGTNADLTVNGQGSNANYFSGNSGNTVFDQVMDSFGYDGASPKVLTLNGLVVRKNYLVQLFTSDDRAASGGRTQLWSDSATRGAGNESATFTHNQSVSIIGRFVADAPTITIYGHGVAQSQTILNGYQLRLPVAAGIAKGPNPEDGVTDVPREVVLSWNPGEFANTHDVYFGTLFDDVNNAGRSDQRGVLAGQGQIAATYDPPGRLDFGQTYYWRIDEVNAPPTSTIFKGDVWSFTVEPLAYPIEATSITTTASSSNSAAEGPENTINGSGLNADDLHSAANTDMWLSSMTGAQPTWIQYEFDRVYKLHQMLLESTEF